MVNESYPWKKDLLRYKKSIIKYNINEKFLEAENSSYTIIEKGIFYSAFIIRKLIDCKGKLSDEADNYKITVKSIKSLQEINSINRWVDENMYDWEKGNIINVLGRDVCNWLIHSYMFFMLEDDKPCSFFCVSSDYDRNKHLYIVSIDDWLKYMEFIATDYVVETCSHYSETKKDYIYTKKKRG